MKYHVQWKQELNQTALERTVFPMPKENDAYEADLIVLLDDDGNEHEFEIIDEIENDDGYFMALIPTEPDESEEVSDVDEYYIFELVNIDGEEQLCEVEDEALLDKLAEIFETRYANLVEEDDGE